ncbi:MAG: SRPBCC domain-containing protein [Corynebacteriales bacterium]|nr:SRPBCC domain-containing protein [Mycobacteriales bacterium]
MVVGETKDVGFNIGVSKTVPYPAAEVWSFLTSPAGIAVWLGEGADIGREKGKVYTTHDGTTGEIRSYHEGEKIRMTCTPAGWDHSTTLQITTTPSATGTTIRFHQEWLADSRERERQRTHWQSVMSKIVDALAAK